MRIESVDALLTIGLIFAIITVVLLVARRHDGLRLSDRELEQLRRRTERRQIAVPAATGVPCDSSMRMASTPTGIVPNSPPPYAATCPTKEAPMTVAIVIVVVYGLWLYARWVDDVKFAEWFGPRGADRKGRP